MERSPRAVAATVSVGSSSWDIRLTGQTTAGGTGGDALPPRTGWTASASATDGSDVPANILDGAAATRWSTGTPMAAGQAVTVDMGAAHRVDRITLDAAGSTGDHPCGCHLLLSADGTTWGTPVATGSGTAALVTIGFPARTARHLRVVQTGSASSWWSIAEFNAYG
jgi:beta-glucosidase